MSEEPMLLQAVADAARLGGRLALQHFRSAVTIEQKEDGSLVTAADRAVEAMLRQWIADRFSDDGILGEELPEHNPAATRRWIIDPIDGTLSFTLGIPLWGTLVAVARGERIIAGAICCPATDDLVCAATGEGCWWNDARSRVSEVSELSHATVLTTDEHFVSSSAQRTAWRELAEAAGASRGWGDCYGYVLVATGRAEVMVDGTMAPWDAAALLPVIEEAGGVFTDWSGRATAFGGGSIATNRALARDARVLLHAAGEAR